MKVILFCLITLTSGLQISLADSLSNSEWDKRFLFNVGVIDYDLGGEFSSTKEGRPDFEVDMDDLDLDEDKVILFFGEHIRLTDRWRLYYDYFHYDDTGSDTSEIYFEFDGLIVPVGVDYESKLDFEFYVVNLSYDFYRTDRSYFGMGLGAHVVDFELEVSSTFTTGNGMVTDVTEDEDLTAAAQYICRRCLCIQRQSDFSLWCRPDELDL